MIVRIIRTVWKHFLSIPHTTNKHSDSPVKIPFPKSPQQPRHFFKLFQFCCTKFKPKTLSRLSSLWINAQSIKAHSKGWVLQLLSINIFIEFHTLFNTFTAVIGSGKTNIANWVPGGLVGGGWAQRPQPSEDIFYKIKNEASFNNWCSECLISQ